ncbi:MAG: hypothetical protein PSV36_06165 [Algoriphagus sp.]|nr:hypothetical protein [Algoriphagus sp.]
MIALVSSAIALAMAKGFVIDYAMRLKRTRWEENGVNFLGHKLRKLHLKHPIHLTSGDFLLGIELIKSKKQEQGRK